MTTGFDPATVLLQRREQSEETARMLGKQQLELLAQIETYKSCWRAARTQGWAAGDLLKAGFLDPAKLPRVRTHAQSNKTFENADEQ